MKSILALLVIVAVANAGIIKSGGLKGSWADEIVVSNVAPDATAPMVDYDSGYTYALTEGFSEFSNFQTTYFGNVSVSGMQGDYTYLNFRFAITGEQTYSADYSITDANYDVTFWTGTGDAMTTLPKTSCSIYRSDNTVSCTVYIHDHVVAGVYSPMITVWDLNGNWAQYGPEAFTDAANQVTFELASNDPDMTGPMVFAEAITDSTIVLGMDAVLQSQEYGGQTVISAKVNDGQSDYESGASSATAYADPNSSELYQVWATLSTGEMGTDAYWSTDIMLNEQTWDSVTGDYTYSSSLTFANFAEPAVWSILIWANDWAGNVGMAATTLTLTVTYDETLLTAAGGVFSCQSLDLYVNDIINYDNEVTVTASDSGTVYLRGECTEKDETTTNYVAIAFTSDEYVADGVTDKVTQTLWNYGANGGPWGQGVAWAAADEDSYPYWSNPGTTVTTGVLGLYDSLTVPNGVPEVSFWLEEVDTITSTGGVQRYNLAQGAASSVVPSIFAVAVAAAVALFRL